MQKLIEKVQSTIQATGGEWGIVLEDLNTGEKWEHHADNLFYAASVIKLPIMAAVFAESEKGNIDIHGTLSLRKEDMVGGSGVLQHMTQNPNLAIYDLMMLMIIQSDNTATNVLIDLVGVDNIQKTMQEIGMEKSSFYHKMMIGDRKVKNELTSRDVGVFLKKLHKGGVVSAEASNQMIDIMKRQQIRDCLAGDLPYQELEHFEEGARWELANKTGWVPGVRHDVGIFSVGDECIAVSVLSCGADDLESRRGLAEIGESVYGFMLG
ncbi:serine hydrolase [Lentibacillus sediminis]|uniref:serine hydrolase n=1 Tax=Lentibacillus sediminis TaxID=1940529 RepID=UPI000C1C4E84|nr:serine hydrolase [Lentibacillus sediminis]